MTKRQTIVVHILVHQAVAMDYSTIMVAILIPRLKFQQMRQVVPPNWKLLSDEWDGTRSRIMTMVELLPRQLDYQPGGRNMVIPSTAAWRRSLMDAGR